MRRTVLLLIDVCVLGLSTVAALLLRDNLDPSWPRFMAILPYLTASLGVGAVVFSIGGFNRSIWRFSGLADYLSVTAGVVVTVFLSVCAAFVFNRLEGVARSLPLLQAVLAIALMVGIRVLMRIRRDVRRRLPRNTEPEVRAHGDAVLLIGLNTVAEFYLRCVAEYGGDSIRIAGILGRSRRHSGRIVLQQPVLGVPEDLLAVLQSLEVHGVRVTRIIVTQRMEDLSASATQQMAVAEAVHGIVVEVLADKLGLKRAVGGAAGAEAAQGGLEKRSERQEAEALSRAASRAEAALSKRYWIAKRLFDVAAASVCLLALTPLIVLVGLCVVYDVGFPAVFWQERVGRFGGPFRLYKFRSMSEAFDASGERRQDQSRMSAIGRGMRRSHLDELPQLYNVLIGQMSIVGPRPLLRIDQPSSTTARLLVRPGLTGWAQVNGGRLLSTRDKEVLDLWYLCHASLLLDAIIILRTINLLVFGERIDPSTIERAWQELKQDAALATELPQVARRAA